jgi:hypothetical protein
MNSLLDYLTMACGPGALCGEIGRGDIKMDSWTPGKSTPIPSFVVTSDDDLVSLLTDVDKNYRPYSRSSYQHSIAKRQRKPFYGEQKHDDHEEGQDLIFLEVEHDEDETAHEETELNGLAVARKDEVALVKASPLLDSLAFSSFDSGMEDADVAPKDENDDLTNKKSQDGSDDGSSYSSFYFHVAPSVGRALWSATKTNEFDSHGRTEQTRVMSKHQNDDMNINRGDNGSSCSSYYFRLAPA